MQMSREQVRSRGFMQKLRKTRKLCGACGKRRALFVRRMSIHGGEKKRLGKNMVVKTDRNHDLCQECKRGLVSRMRRA